MVLMSHNVTTCDLTGVRIADGGPLRAHKHGFCHIYIAGVFAAIIHTFRQSLWFLILCIVYFVLHLYRWPTPWHARWCCHSYHSACSLPQSLAI